MENMVKPGKKASARLQRRSAAWQLGVKFRAARFTNPESGYHAPGSMNAHKSAPKGKRT